MNNEFRGKNLKINGSTNTSIFDVGHSLIDILYTFAHAEFYAVVVMSPGLVHGIPITQLTQLLNHDKV